jgi:hypothetical protein
MVLLKGRTAFPQGASSSPVHLRYEHLLAYWDKELGSALTKFLEGPPRLALLLTAALFLPQQPLPWHVPLMKLILSASNLGNL